jgi:hypothetical protein
VDRSAGLPLPLGKLIGFRSKSPLFPRGAHLLRETLADVACRSAVSEHADDFITVPLDEDPESVCTPCAEPEMNTIPTKLYPKLARFIMPSRLLTSLREVRLWTRTPRLWWRGRVRTSRCAFQTSNGQPQAPGSFTRHDHAFSVNTKTI